MKLDSVYHSKKTLTTTIIALLIVTAIMLPAIGEINTTGTYFWISPTDNIYNVVSNNITISINIANAPETFAWGLKLEYNASALSLVSASNGTWLSSVNHTFFDYVDKVGYVIIEESYDVPTVTGPSGNGWLCNVTFHVYTAGRSKLNLYDTYLLDMDLKSTNYPNNDGFFYETSTFDCLDDVRVISVEVNDTEAQQGEIVNITVVVHNEGNHTNSGEVTVEAVPHDPRQPTVSVGTQAFPALTTCQNHVLVFPWNTLTAAGEVYTIVANATIMGPADDDLHDNAYMGPEVIVVSEHDLKICDKTILTPEVKKDVVLNFTGNPPPTPITGITACGWYWASSTANPSMDGIWAFAPPPSSWWRIIVSPYEPQLLGLEFHVDKSYPNGTFHIDIVLPAPVVGINAPSVLAERTAKVSVTVKNEGKVAENATVYVFVTNPKYNMTFQPLSPAPLEPCTWYQVLPPYGPEPAPCTWWHIIDAPASPWLVSKEFHIDMIDLDTFHIDFVWPDYPEPIEPGPPIVAEWEYEIGQQNIVNLAPGANITLYFHWSLYGTPFDCGEYEVVAFVDPVEANEEMKNWLDNKKDGGTITVQFSDIAIASVEILSDCWEKGMHPIVVPRITVVNLGCQKEKVVVYYIADPNLAVSGDEIVFGLAIVGPLSPGEMRTFTGCSPWGGWVTIFYPIAEPFNPPPYNCSNYWIIAKALPAPGYEDDDMSNNVNLTPLPPPYSAGWHLPTVEHDVTADIDIWAPKRPGIRPQVYYGGCVYINVTVWNESPNAEDVNVTLYWMNGSDPVFVGSALATVPGDNVGWNLTRYDATSATGYPRGYGNSTVVTIKMDTDAHGFKPIDWFALDFVANITIVGPTDQDPCDNEVTYYTSFKVRLCGDINNDGEVDTGDKIKVGNALWSYPGDDNYNPFADVNCDGEVDTGDKIGVGNHLWQTPATATPCSGCCY